MTIDRSLLPPQSPFDLMDRESARIEEFFSSAPDWDAPTRCAEWTARDLAGHLRHLEDYNQACLEGSVRELLAAAPQGSDAFNASGVEKYAALPPDELVAQWRSLNAEYRARMRERGDGVVDTSVGDYPSLFQAYYLATEYAVHGDDFGLTATYEGRDAWRAAFARFALTEQGKPVILEARDGETIVTFEGREYVLTDHDLAEAGAVRLPAAHSIPHELRRALRCFA